jgi:transposase
MIVVGVDAHKFTHTAVAANGNTARLQDELTVPAREKGHQRLLRWARELDDQRLWAIEDCRHVSGGLERFLLINGEAVVRVAPKLMANQRHAARTPGKSDSIDAATVARAAIRESDLPVAKLAGPEREIALLSDHRDNLTAESTRAQCRLRWLLHDLDPGLEPAARSLANPQVLERLQRRLRGREQTAQVRICRQLVRRLGELARQRKALEQELAALVRAHAPALLALPGCGVIVAAKLIAEIADVTRFSSDAKLAIYGGTAPLDASSGRQQRHRLNRSGNRQLNRALHIIAITQARYYPPARAYLARHTANGKTIKEALRAFKRHLARTVYRILKRAAQPRPAVPVGAPSPMPCLT